MRNSLSFLLPLLLLGLLSPCQAQNRHGDIWENTSFLIRGKMGANVYMLPQSVMESSTDQGSGSVSTMDDGYGVTIGAVGRAEVYPVFSPFLSYGYFAEFSAGALIHNTHTYLEHGHRLFVGYHPIMLGGEISYLPFRNAAMYRVSNQAGSAATETMARSKYENLWRYAGIVRVVIQHQHFIDAGYYREYYPHPNGNTKAYHAIKINYWKFNGIDIGFEFSWELHPNASALDNGTALSTDQREKAFYFNLSVSKSFDLFGRPFYRWFR